MFDETLGSLLRIRDDVLDPAAQCGLDRSLVFFFYGDQIRHDAVDPADPVPGLHDSPDRIPVAVITFGEIPEGFQADGIRLVLLLQIPKQETQTVHFLRAVLLTL